MTKHSVPFHRSIPIMCDWLWKNCPHYSDVSHLSPPRNHSINLLWMKSSGNKDRTGNKPWQWRRIAWIAVAGVWRNCSSAPPSSKTPQFWMRRLWKSDRGCLHTTSIYISSSSNRPEPCAWMIVRLIRRLAIGISFNLVEMLCKALSHCPWFIMSVSCGDIELVAAAAFWWWSSEPKEEAVSQQEACLAEEIWLTWWISCSWFASLIILLQVPASSARGCTTTRKDSRCFICERRFRISWFLCCKSFKNSLTSTTITALSRCKSKRKKHHNSDTTISWQQLVIDYYISVLHTNATNPKLGRLCNIFSIIYQMAILAMICSSRNVIPLRKRELLCALTKNSYSVQ